MARYFIELSYKGTNYAGFQIQQNANTIQAEVEKALNILFPNLPSPLSGEGQGVRLTCSSRTDAGVHALQNFFHFDTAIPLSNYGEGLGVRSLNAILPNDIAVKSIFPVSEITSPLSFRRGVGGEVFHCRFSAKSRSYKYYIHQQKNPFLQQTSHHYPYPLDINLLQEAATEILNHQNFTTFSKKHTQVKTYNCNIFESRWEKSEGQLIYHVTANRFLRGMVKGLVGTMVQMGRQKITRNQFIEIIHSHDNTQADFSVPSHGLFLTNVQF